MDMFVPIAVVKAADSFDAKLNGAVSAVLELLRKHYAVGIAFSSGKDSSSLMIVTLMAAMQAKAEGIEPRLLVLNSDTGVENPLIAALAANEMAKIRRYAREQGIDLQAHVARPALLDSWGPRIIGGRALPSYPNVNTDCSVAWKQQPMQALRSQLLPSWGQGQEVVTLTGTRMSESVRRGAAMRARQDSAIEPVRNKMGELVMCPLMHWSTDDVWELLGLVGAGVYSSYTDAQDVLRVYADAGPTSCAVVNDAITEGGAKKGGCGARFGCATCVVVKNDRSMEMLIEKQPEVYGFMRGLNQLRNYLQAIQNDMGRRLWVGRTIKEGHIAIRPDVFSPEEMRRLFRYAVTVDAREREAADALGIEPRFCLIPTQAAIAIDVLWSLHGHWDGFAAIADYVEIHEDGARYDIPESPELLSADYPEPRFYPAGSNWAQACGDYWAGIRDAYLGSVIEECITPKKFGAKDQVDAWDGIASDEGFQIDPEGEAMFWMFEARDKVEAYRHLQRNPRGWAYRWYLTYGLLSISPRQVLSHDAALKRTAFKRMHGLAGPDADVATLLEAAMPWHEVPVEVQQAFLSDAKRAALSDDRERQEYGLRQATLF